jgi:hypothetical protein
MWTKKCLIETPGLEIYAMVAQTHVQKLNQFWKNQFKTALSYLIDKIKKCS